ncbi:MAG: anaphase-promoting complex subunit cdc27 [Heterodermia speciosa]|uniref:Anaphase-promoting complex subunit cdc27 n=1 Tax=Heterodermia speciosa TaxID=116794 RepID=A0A8H3FPS7_9LECA|nr:MAG: anaphase-promoting complex subunit cdc27 [Heterodermia speciosa]
MSPSSTHIVSQLRQLIYYHLDCNLPRNALTFSERLRGFEPKSSEAAYLEGLCYLRLGQFSAAYHSTKSHGTRGTHLGCSYVFAQACLGLERFMEGITAIEKSKAHWLGKSNWNKHTESRRQQSPDAAAVCCLQGKLWHGHGDVIRAIDMYAESLKLNPFMWDAFLGLCDLGVDMHVNNIFRMTSEMKNALATHTPDENASNTAEASRLPDNLSQSNVSHTSVNQPPPSSDPFSISKNRINGEVRPNAGDSVLFEKLNGSKSVVTPSGAATYTYPGLDTPTGPGGGLVTEILTKDDGGVVAVPVSAEPPQAPLRKAKAIPGMGIDFGVDAPPKLRSNSIRSKSRNKDGSDEADNSSVLSRTSTLSNGVGDRKRTISGQVAQPALAHTSNINTTASNDPGAPQRRSVRLFNQIRPQSGKFAPSSGSLGAKEGKDVKKTKAASMKGRSANAFNVGRVVSGNRKHAEPMDIDGKEQRPPTAITGGATFPKPITVNDKVREFEALQWLFELFTKLGTGYFALCHYQCDTALQMFHSLHSSQRETPWVLAQMGRVFFEENEHAEAEKCFARLKAMAPARLEDMEVYSTTLWHTKNEIELAFLSHEIVDIDHASPQAWCAVGNSFSLQRDHDQALKCFKRATQLNPKFAYAFTLQGHEHVSNEEYDKALGAYRAAIAVDKRHYNAWYGLGKVFEKQGKYTLAEQHYRTAALINPTNAVLMCCIGVVLEKLNSPKAALIQYTKSCELAPKSSLSRFKRARVLMHLQEPQLALQDLEVLKDIAPDEANVHFLLGKVYRTLRQKAPAIKHFTTALHLDPKASHYIKEAMEQVEDEEDEDDPDGMVP